MGRIQVPRCTSEAQTDWIRRVREASTRWLSCLFLEQHNTTQRALHWACGSSRENIGGQQPPPALWVTLWKPLLWSHTMGTAVESVVPNAINLTVIKRGELAITRTWIWQTKFIPAVPWNPNQQLCSSAESSWGQTLTTELGGVQMCPIWTL